MLQSSITRLQTLYIKIFTFRVIVNGASEVRSHFRISVFLYFQQQPQVETLTKETVQTFRPGNRTERKVTTSQKKNSQQIGECLFFLNHFIISVNFTFFGGHLACTCECILIWRFRLLQAIRRSLLLCRGLPAPHPNWCLPWNRYDSRLVCFVFAICRYIACSRPSIVYVFLQGHLCGKIWWKLTKNTFKSHGGIVHFFHKHSRLDCLVNYIIMGELLLFGRVTIIVGHYNSYYVRICNY